VDEGSARGLTHRAPCAPWVTDLQRRRACVAAGVGLVSAAGLLPDVANAGKQIEEPLAAAVRTALSAAIADAAPPKPSFANIQDRLAYLRWLGEMSGRLRRRVADVATRDSLLESVWYESKRKGLETALVLGLIQVESAFRKYAVSVVGARGYMQVMPFWARLIGDGDPAKLFHMQTNLRFGCVILRHYLDIERGDLFLALGRYNGSRGRAEYPNAVFANRKLWQFDETGAQNATRS
jgi:soluble lytic murein transglycosylase-like protein